MAEPEKTLEDRVRDRAYALWEKDGGPTVGRTNTGSRPDPRWRPRRLNPATKVLTMGRRNDNHRRPVLKRPVERISCYPLR
jgi:hypothetical protein